MEPEQLLHPVPSRLSFCNPPAPVIPHCIITECRPTENRESCATSDGCRALAQSVLPPVCPKEMSGRMSHIMSPIVLLSTHPSHSDSINAKLSCHMRSVAAKVTACTCEG